MLKISAFVTLFLLSTIISAQTHDWVRTNPGGGGAYSTIGASTSGIILAGSDLSGAYRSQDGGDSWDVVGASSGLTETHISGVGFHRIDGDILYVGTENGIFRSGDGGDEFEQVYTGGYITDIEFGTDVPTTGYAPYHPFWNSSNGQVLKSTDNGMSWSQVSTDLPGGLRILKAIVNPDNADIVYILTGQGRFACGPAIVFRSTDGGVNWENITNDEGEIMDFALDPIDPNKVYITTMNTDCSEEYYWTNLGGQLLRSTNGGATWDEELANNTGVIWIDAEDTDIITLIDPREPYPWIDSSGAWTSSNGGSSFTQSGNVENWDIFFNLDLFHSYSSSYNGICKTLGEDLSNPNNYFWVNYQWVFKTEDKGATFNNIFTDHWGETNSWRSRGFDNVNMMDVAISEADPNIIYTAYFDIGLWRSLNNGESWQSCNNSDYSGDWDGNGGNCATVIADPARSEVVWASMSGNQNGEESTYLIKSMETGQRDSWLLSNNGLPEEEVMGMSLDKNSDENNRTLYITALGDLYKSTDDGATWSMVLECGTCRFSAVDQFDGNIVYTGGGEGLWRSNDGGLTWDFASHSDMTADVEPYFWSGDYDGIFDIKTDPNNSSWVYATALGSNKGLYKSTDRGDNWEHILTDSYMRKVAIAPTNSDILYATSSSAFEAGGYDPNSKGILYSSDGGQSWVPQNDNMAYTMAMAVAVGNEANPTVIVGSPGTGFQKADVVTGVSTLKNDLSSLVYPNPFANEITIKYHHSIFSVSVYDNLGQNVFYLSNINSDAKIDLSHLSKGLYTLQLINDNGDIINKTKVAKLD